MNTGTDRKGAYLRCALIVLVAMLIFLLGDKDFREHVPWWVVTAIGDIGAGIAAWRGFLDQSLTNARKLEAQQDDDAHNDANNVNVPDTTTDKAGQRDT